MRKKIVKTKTGVVLRKKTRMMSPSKAQIYLMKRTKIGICMREEVKMTVYSQTIMVI